MSKCDKVMTAMGNIEADSDSHMGSSAVAASEKYGKRKRENQQQKKVVRLDLIILCIGWYTLKSF